MSLISCKDLAFAYDGVTVLRHLNFKVEQGDYLCILGENGAGKSTLMKGLLGLKKPSAGTVAFGEDLRAKEIGYLPQQTPVQKDFPASVREVVLSGCLSGMGMRPFYSKTERDRADRNMQALEITDLKDRCYRDLSGGQQQRVLLARALCATKKVILLDEPVAGLDPLYDQHVQADRADQQRDGDHGHHGIPRYAGSDEIRLPHSSSGRGQAAFLRHLRGLQAYRRVSQFHGWGESSPYLEEGGRQGEKAADRKS